MIPQHKLLLCFSASLLFLASVQPSAGIIRWLGEDSALSADEWSVLPLSPALTSGGSVHAYLDRDRSTPAGADAMTLISLNINGTIWTNPALYERMAEETFANGLNYIEFRSPKESTAFQLPRIAFIDSRHAAAFAALHGPYLDGLDDSHSFPETIEIEGRPERPDDFVYMEGCDIQVEFLIPEPVTPLLILLGIALLWFRRK